MRYGHSPMWDYVMRGKGQQLCTNMTYTVSVQIFLPLGNKTTNSFLKSTLMSAHLQYVYPSLYIDNHTKVWYEFIL